MKFARIDWLNHLVAFASSLLGILIAFQLDDWREGRNESERMRTALESIKKEIENNTEIYRSNSKKIFKWLDYYEFIRSHYKPGLGLVASEREFKLQLKKNPDRFGGLKLIKKYNDTINVYERYFQVDVAPQIGVSTNSWEAAKSSGALNKLDHARMTTLIQIYNLTEMALGGEEDFYKEIIGDGEIDSMEKTLKTYSRIANVSKFKMEKIEEALKKMYW